ncbi:MAG: cytochrome b/b6 domain-containing protein [Candidatus Hydrogenedentes bacterium]|nr:cytochrome b/b6 domain-containing protein [Candidatus Hydrogenedentota bacterium]
MFKLITLIAIGATLVAIAGHFTLFGAKKTNNKVRRSVRRFGVLEILLHALTVFSFLTLAATGLYAAWNAQPLRGNLWLLHVALGPIFTLGLSILILSWARDCSFEPCDWQWAKRFGGYLWGDKHAPASRFNAGQKGYFWAVGALALVTLVTGLGRVVPLFGPAGQDLILWVHRLAAIAFILAGIAHLYLGTLANPGTLTAMITGKVTPQWAKDHHPLWVTEPAATLSPAKQAGLTRGVKSFEQK